MFGPKNATKAASDALEGASPYIDRLVHDEKLRERLVAAITAGAAARKRAKRQVGLLGLAMRLGSDQVLREQIAEIVSQLQKATGRIEKHRSHKVRNGFLFLTGAGLVVAAIPGLRETVLNKVRCATDAQGGSGPSDSAPTRATDSTTES